MPYSTRSLSDEAELVFGGKAARSPANALHDRALASERDEREREMSEKEEGSERGSERGRKGASEGERARARNGESLCLPGRGKERVNSVRAKGVRASSRGEW